ncbi:MAG: DNA-binding protein [Kosmotoga sp.]|nr:MAG: DNA-binding protein [Kosmotoga sp.]
MLIKEDNGLLFIRFDDGDSFVDVLHNKLHETGINFGVIISGVGMLKKVTIGWFNIDTSGYEHSTYAEPHEVLSLSGNISLKDGKPFAHIHASLAGRDNRVIGGHLFSGTVCNTIELFILKSKSIELLRKAGDTFRPLDYK